MLDILYSKGTASNAHLLDFEQIIRNSWVIRANSTSNLIWEITGSQFCLYALEKHTLLLSINKSDLNTYTCFESKFHEAADLYANR